MGANTIIYDESYDKEKHKKEKQHCYITKTNEDCLHHQYEYLDLVERRNPLENREQHYVNYVLNTEQHTRLIHHNKRMLIGLLVGLVIGSLISGAVVFLIMKHYTTENVQEKTCISNTEDIHGTTDQYSDADDRDSRVRMKIEYIHGTTDQYSDADDRDSRVRMKIECPGCPGNWDRFQGVYYWISNHTSNFANAQTFCRNRGGYVVEIKTTAAYKFLKLLASTRGAGPYWIGATNRPNGGPWRWDKSNTLLDPLLADWEEGQPENKSEDCVTLQKAKGEAYQWHD